MLKKIAFVVSCLVILATATVLFVAAAEQIVIYGRVDIPVVLCLIGCVVFSTMFFTLVENKGPFGDTQIA